MTTMGNNKKNVLFLVPTLGRGGAEAQLIDLVNNIDSTQFNKTLVVFDKNIDQVEQVDKQSIDFHHIARSSKYDFSIFRKIANLIDEKKIDVIHSTLQISMLVAKISVFFSKNKPKIIVVIHTTVNVTKKYELADRLLYRYLMRRCQRVIFVCKKQAQYWGKKYPEITRLSTVIYNGIDIDFFNRVDHIAQGELLKRKLNIPNMAPVICCIAGFRKEKGHQYLIDAFSSLPIDTYLLLVGDGVTRLGIETLVNEKKLTDRVIFLGELADVRPVLATTDVTVLASTAVETFSMAMLESMSMEVPMVATDIGGLSEAIIPEETGDLVPPKDVDALAKALLPYVNKQEHIASLGKNARALVIDKFSKDTMVKATEKILADATY